MIDTPAGFEERVTGLLIRKDVGRARVRFGLSTLLGSASMVLGFLLLTWFVRDASQSGFVAYLSLFFSDASVVTGHLREFALSLLESMPALSFAVLLAALALFAFALSSGLKAFRRARLGSLRLS